MSFPEKDTVGKGKNVRQLKSTDLFEGGTEIVIIHGEEEYRLRITKNDRLILTK